MGQYVFQQPFSLAVRTLITITFREKLAYQKFVSAGIAINLRQIADRKRGRFPAMKAVLSGIAASPTADQQSFGLTTIRSSLAKNEPEGIHADANARNVRFDSFRAHDSAVSAAFTISFRVCPWTG